MTQRHDHDPSDIAQAYAKDGKRVDDILARRARDLRRAVDEVGGIVRPSWQDDVDEDDDD